MTSRACCRGEPDGPAGRRVPEPRRAVVAAGDDGLAVGAEGRGLDGTRVGEDRLEPGVIGLPGGQVGPGGVLPGGIAGGDRRAPALDHPEQARADLILLEGGLAAVEVADRQQTVRFGQRCLEIARQGGDLLGRLRLCEGEVTLAVGVEDGEHRHGHQRRRHHDAVASAARFRRANFRNRYHADGGHAWTGSSVR